MYEPETDWEDVYLTVRGSFIGADFPAERFLRTPLKTLRALLVRIDYHDKFKSNAQSAATAQLAHLAHQYMQVRLNMESGQQKKPQPSTPDDFLPYPKLRPPEDESYVGLSDRTKRILADLIKDFRIPMHVYLRLSNPPKQSR